MSLLVVLGWLLLLAGVVLALWDRRGGRRRRAPDEWEDVEGRVASARVTVAGDIETASGVRDSFWQAEVEYRYVVRGLHREGRQTEFYGRRAGSFAEAERIVAAFPAGAAVEVAVDPADPGVSMLTYDPPNRALLGVGLVVAVIGILLLIARR